MNFAQVQADWKLSPPPIRFSTATCSEWYQEMPMGRVVVMPVNCGYGFSSCDRATVCPLRPDPANSGRPKNGLVTCALRKSMVG